MNAIDLFLFHNLELTDENARRAAGLFFIVCILTVVLRIIVFLGYNIARSGFLLFQRELAKKKEDPRKMKSQASNLTAKIIADYSAIGEKGVAVIDAGSVVENRVSRLGILGLSYVSIGDFVAKQEQASVFIGFTLALIFDSARGIGVMSLAAFVIFRLAAMFLDFSLSARRLSAELTGFIEREVGCFYAGDMSSAVSRLKLETTAAISSLGAGLDSSIKEMAAELNRCIKKSMDDVADNVNLTMESLSKYAEYMDEPFNKWKSAVEKAAGAQNKLYEALDSMAAGVADYAGIQKSIEGSLTAHTLAVTEQTRLMEEAAKSLGHAVEGFGMKGDGLEAAYGAMTAQLETFGSMKDMLEASMLAYEESLKEISGSISGGIGSIIGVHVQHAYGEFNESIKANIDTIVNSNSHLMERMENFLEEISRMQNSRSKSATIDNP